MTLNFKVNDNDFSDDYNNYDVSTFFDLTNKLSDSITFSMDVFLTNYNKMITDKDNENVKHHSFDLIVNNEYNFLYVRILIINGYNICDINIETLINLETFDCSNNKLKTLNLDNNVNLKYLNCSKNMLETLNLNNNKLLEWLKCDNNKLTEIIIDKSPNLIYLYCGHNQLSNYNNLMKNLVNIREVNIEYNLFESLNLLLNPTLVDLCCNNNQILFKNFMDAILDYVSCESNESNDSNDYLVNCIDAITYSVVDDENKVYTIYDITKTNTKHIIL
jgi:Leucine-rich repeat (LRR) protein